MLMRNLIMPKLGVNNKSIVFRLKLISPANTVKFLILEEKLISGIETACGWNTGVRTKLIMDVAG